MVYAFRIGNLSNTDGDVKIHTTHGYWGIKIGTDGTILEDDPVNFNKIHGFLMWTAWGVLGLVQLVSNRYFKVYWRHVMWVHRISGALILLITLVMAFMALSHKKWYLEVGIHQIIGVTILTLVTLIAVGGVFNRSMMRRLRWRTADVLRIKRGHQVRFLYYRFIVFWLFHAFHF